MLGCLGGKVSVVKITRIAVIMIAAVLLSGVASADDDGGRSPPAYGISKDRPDYPPGAEDLCLAGEDKGKCHPLQKIVVVRGEGGDPLGQQTLDQVRVPFCLKKGKACDLGQEKVEVLLEEGRIGTLKELYLVRDALSRKIEDKGYFLSRAIIPPQTIMASSQGEEAMPPAAACLFLVKGSIAALREVQASSQDEKDSFKPLVDEWLKPALGVSSASTSGPASITKTQFEDAVLRLNDLPGVSVETVLTTSKGAWQRPLSGEQYGRICAKMAQKTTSCEAAPKRFVIATHMRRPGAEACTSSAGDEGSPDGNDGGASGQTDPFLSSQDLIPLVNRHNGPVFIGLDIRKNQ